MGIKLAGALETAHRAEILHRDVKPQNILLTEFGEPALADFGVAMLQSSTQTTTGLFDFTTLHVAPELLEGGQATPATDVYELASTLYQLLAGQSAFRAFAGESPASIILRILRDPVQPLTRAEIPIAAVGPGAGRDGQAAVRTAAHRDGVRRVVDGDRAEPGLAGDHAAGPGGGRASGSGRYRRPAAGRRLVRTDRVTGLTLPLRRKATWCGAACSSARSAARLRHPAGRGRTGAAAA